MNVSKSGNIRFTTALERETTRVRRVISLMSWRVAGRIWVGGGVAMFLRGCEIRFFGGVGS